MDDLDFTFDTGVDVDTQQRKTVPPENVKRIVCRHWLRHECQRGDACTYIHAMEEDKMPDCEYGDHCTIPGCPLKHPPKMADRECLFYKQGFCPYGKRCKYKQSCVTALNRRHIRYNDGALPFSVDISSRNEQSIVDVKEKTILKSGIRRSKCRSYEVSGECQYGENCVYSHELLDCRISALDLRSENELGFPQYPPNATFSYFFFNSPYLTRLADSILRGVFSVPARHMEALNQAFTKPNNYVYMFVSAQNSKLIHAMCVMKEAAERERDYTKPFTVEWLKVVHMPFMVFDREDRAVKLDKLEDGAALDKEMGDDLFVWVWRHPNTLLMMRQSMLVKQQPAQALPDEDDVALPPIAPELEASCAFVHGESVLLELSRRDLDDAVHTGVFRLTQSAKDIAASIHVGTIVIVFEKESASFNGLFQAISTPVHYVGKSVFASTPCIHFNARWWFEFKPVAASSLAFSLQRHQRVMSRNLTIALIGAFFSKCSRVPYPILIQLPALVSNPNRYCINVDIPHADFHTGEFIRNHPIYKKFTQSNGWGYLELLGEGSLEDNAVFVKASSQPLTICFYTDDGLHFVLVVNAIKQMLEEVNNEYQKWCKEHGVTPYKKD